MTSGAGLVQNIVLSGLDVSKLVETNGSANLTIGSAGPNDVGTATITSWLKVRVQGVDYYIPMWT